mmetsp:Transcript_28762/g.81107  ORF Transcript_28762/g.81107 Transcript_28762/m.81107 type:complete len:526 (+) Transcript_28762:3905-5482(+)
MDAIEHRNSQSATDDSDQVDIEVGKPVTRSTGGRQTMPLLSRLFAQRTLSRLQADFVAEMRHLSKLRHPNITTVMGAVLDSKDPLLVMEYMDHGSLYDVIHNDTLLLEGDHIHAILNDISLGVRFLHAATPNVIHGDLKAQNILIDGKSFRAKVADFGLSQKRSLGARGTPFWMAPELLRREAVNSVATDVYAFGIMLFEIYSRKEPYEGEDCDEVLKQVANPLEDKHPTIPHESPPLIRKLMRQCLNKDSSKRPTFEALNQTFRSADVAEVEPKRPFPISRHQSKAMSENGGTETTDQLLHGVFPRHIAKALKAGRKVEPESHDLVTIFFSDIVNFTKLGSSMTPLKISDMLDRLYHALDDLSEKYDVFKVETIGDAYMACSNLAKEQPDHTLRIAKFAIEAIHVANQTLIDPDDPAKGTVTIRVGFHSGPVVANVVGSRNPRYCLFGDTVNTASRMESHSMKNRIHCSDRSAKLLRDQGSKLRLISRGDIEIKGKGIMKTYWVNEANRQNSLVTSSSSRKLVL